MKWAWRLAAVYATAAFAQNATFDVASVKLNTHCETGGRSGGGSTPGRIALECADLRDLILTAYGIYAGGATPAAASFRMQVVGGPSWIDSTRYDIAAKPAGEAPRSEMYGPMLRSLLEDRFALKVHRETRESRVYLLTAAKDGPKLSAAKDGACRIIDGNRPAATGNSSTPACGTPQIKRGASLVTVDIPGATMANLSAQLGMVMDHEVIDRTSLAGRFDIHLEVNPADLQTQFVAGRTIDQPGQSPSDDADSGPSLSNALQRQLGLKLEPTKGLAHVIVIDHIERPRNN